jgi:hypothetical protein
MAKKSKLTPWFPPEVKPVRNGVYLTRGVQFKHQGVFRFWNGECWSFMDEFDEPAPFLTARLWRGLAEPPK